MLTLRDRASGLIPADDAYRYVWEDVSWCHRPRVLTGCDTMGPHSTCCKHFTLTSPSMCQGEERRQFLEKR